MSFIENLKKSVYTELYPKIEPLLKEHSLYGLISSNFKLINHLFYLNEVKRVLDFIKEENNTFWSQNYEPFQIFLNSFY